MVEEHLVLYIKFSALAAGPDIRINYSLVPPQFIDNPLRRWLWLFEVKHKAIH